MTQHDGHHGVADRPAGVRRGTPSPHLPAPSPDDIPDKLYFRIGEVARLCAVQAYVLRFWETEFPQLRPNKGGTGQRLFRRRDVEMAMRIRRLLYEQGYTIPGARQLLKAESRPHLIPPASPAAASPEASAGQPASSLEQRMRALHHNLRELQAILAHPPGSPPPTLPPLAPEPPLRSRAPRTPAFHRFRTEPRAIVAPTLFDPPETAEVSSTQRPAPPHEQP